VVDSGSKDRTREVATEFGARVIGHPWPGFGQQKNLAQNAASHDWILNIDADEEVPAPLREEIDRFLLRVAAGTEHARLVKIPRTTQYLGRWIRHGGWYPNYLIRFAHRTHARWSEPALHEAWCRHAESRAPITRFATPLRHYTFKDINDQVQTNLIYARRGFEDLKKAGARPSLLRLLLKPIGKFLETYFFKLGCLDGLAGLIISVNASHSMFLRQAYFFEPAAGDGNNKEHEA
jgi:glycosyltransferase involved in cell wall biosynthesis